MNTHSIRVEAYDDGYFPYHFKGGRGSTFIVGVLAEEISKVSKIAWTTVRTDMNTASRAIIEISRILGGDVVLLDGITYAGFDVVDPDYVSSILKKSVIVIFQYSLNLRSIEKALRKHFTDWKTRLEVIERVYLSSTYVDTWWRAIRVYASNMSITNAINVVRSLCMYSPVPEPLRIADKIASAVSKMHVDKLLR